MKKLVFLAILACGTGLANAQTFDEWFNQKETQIRYLVEQINALKAYGRVINKGYDVAYRGLSEVFTSKTGDH